MEKGVSITLALLFTTSVFLPHLATSQSPNKMSYQAVLRDASNNLIVSQMVGMQLSILQSSPIGIAVYIETQTPNTNTNGLVSIEIGNGTIVAGDFSTIDWTDGPYFIKTETDPTGGTSYTISGTSQFLSVPYALHSSTADSIVGGISISETDPVFSASLANGITTLDTANWNNHTIDTDTQIDSTGIASLGFVAGPHVDSTAIADMGFRAKYVIGDFTQGGIVFWLDETSQHGLVCAKTDQSSGMRWFAGTNGSTRANGDGPYSGEANTYIIISSLVAIGDDGTTYAARLCNELQITEAGITYGDWYLPSKEELNKMFINKSTIDTTAIANGGAAFAAPSFYWSSTESSTQDAWYQGFVGGIQFFATKNNTYYIRAVRAF